MRAARLALALALLSPGGCVLLVDDPEGWTVVEGASGAAGAGAAIQCSSDGESCTCGPGQKGTALCRSSSPSGSLCCAETGYPGGSASCTCASLSCDSSGGYCYCSFGGSGQSSCFPKSGQICCQTATSCQCDNPDFLDCSPGKGREVIYCGATELTCFSSTKKDSCMP